MIYFTFFFFNDTATTEIYTLSLHDALPILHDGQLGRPRVVQADPPARRHARPHGQPEGRDHRAADQVQLHRRSEEHTSELQSRQYLVCRLLLEKKQKVSRTTIAYPH